MRFCSIIYAAAAPLVAGAALLATDQTQCGLAAKVTFELRSGRLS